MCKSTISHLDANLKNKPQEFFERELRQLSSIKTGIKATDTINKKGLVASYMVSHQVTKTSEPHTIVEDLILPAAAHIAWTMVVEKGPKKLYRQHEATVTWQEMF
jgi:hypothetical protein